MSEMKAVSSRSSFFNAFGVIQTVDHRATIASRKTDHVVLVPETGFLVASTALIGLFTDLGMSAQRASGRVSAQGLAYVLLFLPLLALLC
jgi:hypothetical protein